MEIEVQQGKKEINFFAKTNFRNQDRVFGIKTIDRRQHTYIVGKTGTGKSTLITNMAIQDIVEGHGVCVIDPHGDLIETIVKKIPQERLKDVIYFNPIDTEYPIGFNVLEVPDVKYKHLVASDLMAIFTKIWAGVWSARMEYILSNCILALIDTPDSTLLGIPKILVDKEFRQKIISNVKDPVVRGFWITEYEAWSDQFRNEAIVPIQNKVGQFLSTGLIRNIVGQTKSTINISDIINNQKIFLVNLSKGRIGEDNSALLGAMIVTKIQLAAMERVRIHEGERKDFYLYIDEFQNFATESIATILSEARKYRLNLIVAHQYLGQLSIGGAFSGKTDVVRDAIFGNVGTTIIFRVGAADAEFLEKEVTPEFTIEDLVNLPNRRIYIKLMVDGVTSRSFSATTLPPVAMAVHESNVEEVIESSRKLYSRPRAEVEEEIFAGGGAGVRPRAATGKASEEKRAAGVSMNKRFQPPMKFATNLGDMGIEFEASRRFERQGFFKKFEEQHRLEEAGVTKEALSLDKLKAAPRAPAAPAVRQKSEAQPDKKPAIDDLKQAIQKALEEK